MTRYSSFFDSGCRRWILGLAFSCGAVLPASATWVDITSLGFSYCQSFDGLPNSGSTFTWLNDNTSYSPDMLGWLAEGANGFNNGSTARVGPVGSSSGVYSYGQGTSTDRALGAQPSSGTGNLAFGVLFYNGTSSAINSLSVSYTGQQWYRSGSGAQSLQMSYAVSTSPNSFFSSGASGGGNGIGATISPTVLTGAASENGGGPSANWLSASGGNFTSPVTGGSAGVLNGTLATNSTSISTVLTGLNLAAGDYLFIRFVDVAPSGTAQGLAINNFCISDLSTAVPEPATWAAAGSIAIFAGLAALRNRKAPAAPRLGSSGTR